MQFLWNARGLLPQVVVYTALVGAMGCSEPAPPAGPITPVAAAQQDNASVPPSSPVEQPATGSQVPEVAVPPSNSAVGSSPSSSAASSPDPFSETPGDAPQWSNQSSGNLKEGVRRLARFEAYDAPLLFGLGTAETHFALLAPHVVDLSRGESIGQIEVKLNPALEKLALSPDGKYLARQASPDNLFEIEIYETSSGQRLHSLQYSSKPFQRIEYLQFTRHGRLIAAVWEDSGSRLLIWDVTKPKPLRDLTMPRITGQKVALSEDGRLMAAVLDQRLEIHDLAQGKKLTTLDPPPHDKPFNPMTFISGLAFSPDGTELASLFNLDGFRLVVWKTDGNIVVDHHLGLQIGGGYNYGPPIEWSPDGIGWLLHRNFYFDRRLGVIAWMLETPVQHYYHHRWLSSTEVIASVGDFQDRSLVAVKVPRAELDRAAAALQSDADALLRPGDGVTLDIQVGATRFANAAGVTQALREALTERLTTGGLTVGDGQPVTLSLRYHESEGAQLNVVSGGPGLRGQPTGQQVQETVVQVDAKMTRAGRADPIWQKQLRRGNPHIVRGGSVDDQAVRKATFNGIEYTLNSMSIPYFVPADSDAPGLPIITDLK